MGLFSSFFGKKIFLLAILILSYLTNCLAQEIPWIEILESNESIADRKIALDSFYSKDFKSLPVISKADYYHDVGNRLHYRNWMNSGSLASLDSAISFTGRAVLFKQGIDTVDRTSLKKSLFNLGYFYSQKEAYFDSIRSYLAIVDMGDDDAKTHAAFLELGLAYMEIGDYHKAEECFNKIIEFYENNGTSKWNLRTAHMRLADNYSYMGHLDNAHRIQYHLKVADSISTPQRDMFHKAQIKLLRGNLMLMLKRYNEAIHEHKGALQLSEYLTDENLAFIHNSLGVSYDKLGNDSLALFHLGNAISLNTKYSAPYENIGDLHKDLDDFESAILNYQKAIKTCLSINPVNINFNTIFSRQELELSAFKTSILHHMVTMANGWLEYYEYDKNLSHLQQAKKTFEVADQLIDIIRSESTEYKTQLYWREQSAKLYMKAVETCYLLNEPEKAYYFMERNKALLLLENISNERAKDISQLPDSVAQREFELKRKIFMAENELSNAGSETDNTQIRDSIFRYKRQFDLFLDHVDTNYPDYARLKTQLDILPIDDFRSEYLVDDQVVLQYILNEEQGYGLLHMKEESQFFKIEDVALLNQKLKLLNRELSSYNLKNTDQMVVSDLSYDILHFLLPENGLGVISGKKVLVVPDYELQRIPFEALVIRKAPLKYLIEEAEIRYAYSVSYLHSKMNTSRTAEKSLMSIAPVSFGTLGLARLGFSLDEVEGIKSIYGGELFKEKEATKNTFLSRITDYRVLHLSTHADVDENGNHWVAFKDKKLYLNEIYASKNQADMVVLSACNTSGGDLKKGEGVMSLARAFFNAGAQSVVSSLWTVQDRAGKEIMLEFYRGLDKGLTKSHALRDAKQAYLHSNSDNLTHPFFWASLIVIGDNSALDSSFSLWDYWPMAIALVLIGAFWLKRSKLIKSERDTTL